ncbi:MAG TPA: DUF2491 family protein [Acetobacteraceae bacterium]
MSAALVLTPVASALRLPVVAGAMLVAAADNAHARSSGGYSRPSSPRTPSFSAPRSMPRTPSTSGGYGRPSTGFGQAPFRPPVWSSPSAGDQAFSRERSAQALQSRRAQEEALRQQQQEALRPRTPPTQASPGWFGGIPRVSPPRQGWFADRGWSAPPYATGGRSFGVWNGLFLWFMLDNLMRPGYANFFRSHQDDPGYQQWRREADALARDNADLREKLNRLDQQVESQPAAPADPGWLPADVPPEVATAESGRARTPSTAANDNSPTGSSPDRSSPGMGGFILVLIVGGAGLAFLAWRRRQGTKGQTSMNPLRTAGAVLRNAVSPQPYKPELFRVGMTVTADPTPFILAAGVTKVPAPEQAGGNMLVNIQAVGRIADGAASLVRLYLPDNRGMFQLHMDAAGVPDECRYFGLIDEVTPADPAEWGVWLDQAEGMIGWPEFQTKDGKLYSRVWAPGSGRIAPRVMEEVITTAEGSQPVRSQAMLYAAPTGAPQPAPQTEYILVAATERAGQAWVQILAGIDVNPAALSLA